MIFGGRSPAAPRSAERTAQDRTDPSGRPGAHSAVALEAQLERPADLQPAPLRGRRGSPPSPGVDAWGVITTAVEWSLNRGLFNFGPLNRGPAAVNRGLLAVVGRLSVRVEKAAAD